MSGRVLSRRGVCWEGWEIDWNIEEHIEIGCDEIEDITYTFCLCCSSFCRSHVEMIFEDNNIHLCASRPTQHTVDVPSHTASTRLSLNTMDRSIKWGKLIYACT
jgi:hypothetical protein